MLATLIDKPFDREGWIFEIKFDGYRALGHKNPKVELLSRNQKSFNDRFPTIVKALEALPGRFVVDGEIVIEEHGRSQFQLMQNYQRRKTGKPIFYLFDILSYEGRDLTKLPLLDRKKILKKLLTGQRGPLKFSAHIEEKGIAFFRKAKKKKLEGIIAKKADSSYQFLRSKDWLKIKAGMRQEVVIGGFTQPRGGRSHFGALLVGVYEKGKLVYAGHVGGGFDQATLKEVYGRLKKVVSKKCPFAIAPRPNTPVTWVKPQLVCEVAFTEWTEEGNMRHPIFKGLRIDKSAKAVRREIPLRKN